MRQKINLDESFSYQGEVIFTYIFKNYLFTAIKNKILKFKILIKSEQNDLEKFNSPDELINDFRSETCSAIAITNDGKIFYEKSEN